MIPVGPPPPRSDPLTVAVWERFAAAIGTYREEDAPHFTELVDCYTAFHRCRDRAKSLTLSARVVELMGVLGLHPGNRGCTPLNCSLTELLDRDAFRVLERPWEKSA